MKPVMLKISKIEIENNQIKTFYFTHELKSKPGQFVMLWIPRVDQKPFSISFDDGQTFGLTVFKRGPLTEKIFTLNVGDRVGITGPFGTCYSILPDRHYIMVAGGYGAAPLANLAEKLTAAINRHPEPRIAVRGRPDSGSLSNQQTDRDSDFHRNDNVIDFIMGARSKDLLLFENQLNKISNLKLHITTDDGSAGKQGRVTDVLKELLDPDLRRDDNNKPVVCACGPEMMEKAVLDLCNKYDTDCEISIERYMKCGFGVCGQCAVDEIGFCMCTDGPVVKRELANKIFEFGKYHRNKAGNIIKFN